MSAIRLSWPLLVLLLSATASGQVPPVPSSQGPAPAAQADQDPLGRTTPHGAVTGFLRAAQRGDYARAAQYLDTRHRGEAAEALAAQLHTVLDRGLVADLDNLSKDPAGNLEDGLRTTRDRVGTIKTREGDLEILLERLDRRGQPSIWLFASETLARIPDAANELGLVDLTKYLPRVLVEQTLFSVPLFRWISIPLFLALALVLAGFVVRLVTPLLRPLARRLSGETDDRAVAAIRGPIRLILVAAAIRAFSILGVSLAMRQFWIRVATVVAVVGLAWLTMRLVDVAGELAARRLRRTQAPGKIAMWTLVRRLLKAAVAIAAVLWLIQRAGADLTAVLTGLGIGGIGVALAAQKTIENLFGGMMIISDEPIRVGDFCRAGDVTGTVEDIGLRSTRIRTLARTVVAVPNGQLASMNIENFALRDKFLFRHVVGLRYETSADQLRFVLARIRTMLYAHPKVEREGARARFVAFGGSSLDLEVVAYVWAPEFADFLGIQEDLLLRIMDIVDEAGTSVAFPSQTAYLSQDTPLDAEKVKGAETQVRQWRERGELPFPDFRPGETGEVPEPIEYPPPGSSLRTSDRASKP